MRRTSISVGQRGHARAAKLVCMANDDDMPLIDLTETEGYWVDDTDEDDPTRWVLSMSIITRDAHVAPGEVHDRMPSCLTPDAYDDWLGDHLDTGELLSLLDRASFEVAHDLVHHEVTRDVGSVRNTGPRLIEPVG